MRFKPWSLPLLAACVLPVCGTAAAEDYDGRFYVAPMYSHVLEDKERPSQNGMGFTVAIGKRVSTQFELELLATQLNYDEDDRKGTGLICGLLGTCKTIEGGTYKSTSVGAGGNFFFSPASQGGYLHGDAQYGSGSRFVWNAGLGYRWMLDDRWGIRAEALYHSDDDVYAETQINLGLHAYIGKKPAPPAPEPVAVVPVVEEPAPTPACVMPEAGAAVSFDNCKPGDVMVLRGVHFATADSTLTADASAILDGVATALTAKPDIRVEVAGHTDSVGEDDYNMALSQRRAKSVKTYLSEHGVDAARMHSVGFGESQPVDSNDTDEGRELNRRVELKLVAADAPAFGADEEPAPVKRKKRAVVETEATDATTTDYSTDAAMPVEGDTSSGSTDAVMSTEEEKALVDDANGTQATMPADTSSTDAAMPADAGAESTTTTTESTTTDSTTTTTSP